MVTKFLPMYEEQSAKICDSLSDVKEQRMSLDKKLKEVTDEINATDPAKDGIVSRYSSYSSVSSCSLSIWTGEMLPK